MTFVDLAKLFNTVNRDGLWKIMVKFGRSNKLTVNNGVKQGCILAPTLFSMFSTMLIESMSDTELTAGYSTPGV